MVVGPSGFIVAPEEVEIVVVLEQDDLDPFVWVSDSPRRRRSGEPAGRVVGGCSGLDLEPLGGGRLACAVDTVLLEPGRSYYWWLTFSRWSPDGWSLEDVVDGPYRFTLRAARTYAAAPLLPSAERFDGERSVKHRALTRVVYATMRKVVQRPRMLAVACWTASDYRSVRASVGGDLVEHGAVVVAFWLRRQPRWIHLSPWACKDAQRLLDRGAPTGRRASSLATVLHEAIHAYGLEDEAQVNCYAVQLVPVAARVMGLAPARADYLRRLALNYTRRTAPPGYWDSFACRDGGEWDLLPDRENLG